MRAVDDQLVEGFVTASRALVGIAVRSVEAASPSVTVPQHRVLVLLASEGDLTVGEVGDLLGVAQSNASRVVDRLQRLELVARKRGSEDGRVVRVALTGAGRAVVETVMAHRRTEIAAVLAKLPKTRARELVAALEAFNLAANEHRDGSWTHGVG
jgi:DNA-binding MarR family transcriptional regulator